MAENIAVEEGISISNTPDALLGLNISHIIIRCCQERPLMHANVEHLYALGTDKTVKCPECGKTYTVRQSLIETLRLKDEYL